MAADRWVEVFRAGRHTAADGRVFEVRPEHLDEAAQTYDPSQFRAPLILSHRTHGVPDRQLADHPELAHGIVGAVKRMGDRLLVNFARVSDRYRQWQDQGRVLDRSASFYLPNSPHNPTPGRWHLRHVAALGTSPPAVKGMEPWELSEPEDGTIAIADFFSPGEGTDDFVEFGCGCGGVAGKGKGELMNTFFNGMRDYLVQCSGIEGADRVLPRSLIEALGDASEGHGDDDDYPVPMPPPMAPYDYAEPNPPEDSGMSADDVANFEERIAELEDELAAQRAQTQQMALKALRAECASFVEGMRDRLTPAQLEERTIDFSEDSVDVGLVDFMAGLSPGQRAWFKGFLEDAAPPVSPALFQEIGNAPAPNFSGPGSTPSDAVAEFDESSLRADRAIRAYMAEHNITDYLTGATQFASHNGMVSLG